MGVALWAGLWLLIGPIIQQGVLPGLLPPENVTLMAENCRTFLTWQPALNSTNGTQYEVERLNDARSDWIKETSCRGNHLRQTQRCELHLSNLLTHYQARVRARDGDRRSEWARSKLLQPYKDMVIGPLNLSLAAADGNLTVVVSVPYGAPGKMCPYLSILYVQINLTEGNNKPIMEVASKSLMEYTFDGLQPDTNYCVHVKVLNQPAKKAIQCIRMPSSWEGNNWSLVVLVFVITVGVTLVGVAGILFIWDSLQRRPSEVDFPKSLRFLNQDPSGNYPVWRPILRLEQNLIASLSTVMLPPDDTTTEQQTLSVPLIPSGYRAWGLSDYCANGFGQGRWSSVEDTTSLSVAGLDSSSRMLKDEDPADGSYQMTPQLLETPVSCPRTSPPGIPTSSPRFLLYSRSSSNHKIVLNHKTGSNCEEAGLSSSFGAAISLNSMKLQSVLDVCSPMCSSGAYVTMNDYGTQPEVQLHKVTESQGCPSQPGHPEDPAIHSDSNLEGAETVTFSGYEPRQPILPCKLFVEQHQVQETYQS